LESLAQDPALVQALRSDRLACPGKSAQAAALGVAQKYSRDTDLAVEGSDSPIAISERYFRKIVEELADNAFKFSRPGTPVQVATTVTSAEFTLAIRDEGLGLTPEQIAQVGAYRQFDRQRHEQQGLGFGMAFVHRLVELHGGRFWIESPNPQSTLEAPGSTFRIALPLAAGIVLQAHGFTAPA
jgi:signal transduction histidine kinase